ncbi:toxin Cry1Ac domain D-VI-related protein [Listeria rocourtiae]|uniref:toxin Cry1Ac domain D-VI-related protein n=1 Tax=Listeria rocourtiae TaxID=647910 RepID=UPI003D2F9A90
MIFRTQITKKILATSAALAILGGAIVTPVNVLSVAAAQTTVDPMELAVSQNVQALFNNNNVAGTIKAETTQTTINSVKTTIAYVSNATKKAEFTAQVAEAQKQLNERTSEKQGRAAVNQLFKNNDPSGTIKDGLTHSYIDGMEMIASFVTNPTVRAELQADIANARAQVDGKTGGENAAELARQEAAKKAVEGLFNNNNTAGTIKENTDQAAVDSAKKLVALITDTTKKAELEAAIAKAQTQVTEKETAVSGTVDAFMLKTSRYITGTYAGDITSMSLDVNGKRYYGGTVHNGTFNFYALDKIFNVNDVVVVNLHGADKAIKTSLTVTVK